MICFLTSRMDDPDTGKLNSANRFADELRKHFPAPCRALVVCSDPDDPEKTDYYSSLTREMLEEAGFGFERFRILDGRNASRALQALIAQQVPSRPCLRTVGAFP